MLPPIMPCFVTVLEVHLVALPAAAAPFFVAAPSACGPPSTLRRFEVRDAAAREEKLELRDDLLLLDDDDLYVEI